MTFATDTYSAADLICDEMDRVFEDSDRVKELRARQDAQRAAQRAARAAAPTVRPMGADDDLLDGIARLEALFA